MSADGATEAIFADVAGRVGPPRRFLMDRAHVGEDEPSLRRLELHDV
jgi:hypothetical protein